MRAAAAVCFALGILTACMAPTPTPSPSPPEIFVVATLEPTPTPTPEGVRGDADILDPRALSPTRPSGGHEVFASGYEEIMRRGGSYLVPVLADLDPGTPVRISVVPRSGGRDGVAALFILWQRHFVVRRDGKETTTTHITTWKVLDATEVDGKIRVWALEGLPVYFASCRRYYTPSFEGEFGGVRFERRENFRWSYCAIAEHADPPEGLDVWDGAEASDGGFWILYARHGDSGYRVVIDRFDVNGRRLERITLPKPIIRWTFMTPDGLVCGYLGVGGDERHACYRPSDLSFVAEVDWWVPGTARDLARLLRQS